MKSFKKGQKVLYWKMPFYADPALLPCKIITILGSSDRLSYRDPYYTRDEWSLRYTTSIGELFDYVLYSIPEQLTI